MRARRIWPMLWLLLVLPAGAFENDYAALMRAHAGEVLEVQPGLRRLELPGPVIVEARRGVKGSLSYSGTDLSGLTAAGCGFAILIEAVNLSGRCPGMITPAEHAVLEAELLAVARFVGAHAFPPVPEGETRGRLIDAMRAAGTRDDRSAARCGPADSGRQDAAEMLRNLARPGGQAAIRRMISLPRLPVENPCP